jgi:hypothetical protein
MQGHKDENGVLLRVYLTFELYMQSLQSSELGTLVWSVFCYNVLQYMEPTLHRRMSRTGKFRRLHEA